eukprot:TRINITY_DN5092_c0_g1_i1.p1 TRINITY_DN5092_c0_g1~~TRINITY_DN5092_c0_g1_i1.p1  ORF type:complete len:603 (+),score=82.23 TRINITY_DN5092_c0_g1_i1:94-1902(+)
MKKGEEEKSDKDSKDSEPEDEEIARTKKRKEAPVTQVLPKILGLPENEIPFKRGQSHRSSSSRFKLTDDTPSEELKCLPLLKTASPEERGDLFIQKIRQCKTCFDFTKDSLDRFEEKEIKAEVLQELIQYISKEHISFSTTMYSEITEMLKVNLFRPLPPRLNPTGEEYDPEEDEPILEAAWPHLHMVYAFFLKFINHTNFDPAIAKQYISKQFVTNILDLFDSEDPRERDCLKTILHSIYGRVILHRAFIRNSIANTFQTLITEMERFNGVAELLEVLGSIVNGFTVPLRQEHVIFLQKTLLPLHKLKSLSLFHPQLSYCVIQFIDKSPTLTKPVIKALMRYWPVTDSAKEILFVTELEEILEFLDPPFLMNVYQAAFTKISQCLCSHRYLVVERALKLLQNNEICRSVLHYAQDILPIILPSLCLASRDHWSRRTRVMADEFLQILFRKRNKLCTDVIANYNAKREREKQNLEKRKEKWKKICEKVNEPSLYPITFYNHHTKSYVTSSYQSNINQILNIVEFDVNELNKSSRFFGAQSSEWINNTKLRRKSLLPMDYYSLEAIKDHVPLVYGSDSTESDSDTEDEDDVEEYTLLRDPPTR